MYLGGGVIKMAVICMVDPSGPRPNRGNIYIIELSVWLDNTLYAITDKVF